MNNIAARKLLFTRSYSRNCLKFNIFKNNEIHKINQIKQINRSLSSTTTIYYKKNHHDSVSSDSSSHDPFYFNPEPLRKLGPKDKDPHKIGPTPDKSLTEGHTVSKAKESLGIKRDNNNIIDKVKNTVDRVTTPDSDVQAAAAASSLKERADYLKSQRTEQTSNVQDKETLSDKTKGTVSNLQDKTEKTHTSFNF
ncbi:2702_t:CDS:2 [Entrophospora sp. SA101]|nr:2702_t:CDS:2 [Entrophospora sp. SA101]